MSQTCLGVALVGVGMVAETHLEALADLSGRVTLNGVYVRDPDARAAFAAKATARVGRPVTAYASLDALARDPDVQVVGVLTPPNARQEIVAPLVQAGKAILLEKPVARTYAEAQALVALCQAAGAPLGVFLQHRVRAASVTAARRIAAGEFGALGLAEIAVPWWRAQSYYDEPGRGTYDRDGGGVLISQAIHTLDLALTLTGPVREVTAMTATSPFHRMEAEDFAVAGLRFAGGAVGSVTASTASFPGASESIRLHFEDATITLVDGTLHVAWRDGRVEAPGAAMTTGGGADPMAFTHDWHRDVWDGFLSALRDDQPLPISGRDALAVHALIDAMTRSAAAGQTVTVAAT